MLVEAPEQVFCMRENAAGEGRKAAASVINDLIHTLRETRRELRITQLDLAARLSVTEITVVEWETRRDIPATGNLLRWAHELGCVVEIRDSLGESVKESDPSSRICSVEALMTRASRVLRQARVRSGHTQEELGTELGVSTWTIRMWESAQRTPRLVHLVEWCGNLNCQLVLAKA